MIKFMRVQSLFEIEGFCTAFNFDWNENYVFSGERHNFWEIVFVKSGKVEITEDENIYTLGEGNLLFHAPMEFHRIKSAEKTSPTGYVISFCASGELPSSLTEGVFTLDAEKSLEYERICSLAVKFVENPSKKQIGQEAASLLSAFILSLERELAEEHQAKTQSAVQWHRIITFMNENAEQNLTLEEIAESLSVSVSYIKLLFKAYAGISPKSYFNDLRLKKASSLLLQGFSSTEVSLRMNFSSPSYFCSFYKKRVGLPPTRQRQKTTDSI